MNDPWAPPDRQPLRVAGAPGWPSASGGPAPEPGLWTWLTTDVLVVGIAALLVLGGSSSVAVSRNADRSAAPDPAVQAALDARLPALQSFVERERGLRFTSPVVAQVLDDDAFLEALYSGEEDAGTDPGDSGATLQALGLLDEDDDLDEEVGDALDAGVVGFYDSEADRLFVRGEQVDPYVELVVVHELVHALQDQVFDLDRPDLEDADDERFAGFQALVEGDATRVEEAFRDAQDADTRDRIREEESRRFGRGSGDPSVVELLLGFPYYAGRPYVEQLLEAGGQDRLDAAFRTPPTTTEQVLEPLSDDLSVEEVAIPTVEGERVDQGVLGAVGLALLLGEDPTQDGPHLGWDGDRYATYDGDGGPCTVVDVVAEDERVRDELVDGLDRWASAVTASVTPRGERRLRLDTCP